MPIMIKVNIIIMIALITIILYIVPYNNDNNKKPLFQTKRADKIPL